MPSKLHLLAVPLVLSALLLAASAAHATPLGPAATPLAFEGGFDAGEAGGEEFEFDEAECEEAEEELEAGELSEAEVREICDETDDRSAKTAKGSSSAALGQCVLRSAHAHASESHDSLKVTVGYTASEPTGATIEVRSGSTRLASAHHHLGRSGVLRITRNLGSKGVNQVVVRFTIPSCAQFQTNSVKVGR